MDILIKLLSLFFIARHDFVDAEIVFDLSVFGIVELIERRFFIQNDLFIWNRNLLIGISIISIN